MTKGRSTEDEVKSLKYSGRSTEKVHENVRLTLSDKNFYLFFQLLICYNPISRPSDKKEEERIEGAGMKVDEGRIEGDLAVSRAFGDFQFKQNLDLSPSDQSVSCLPDIKVLERSNIDQFVAIACDGVFDIFENNDLANVIRSNFAQTENLVETSERILDISLNKGSTDNMTLIIIAFDTLFQK